MFRQRRIRQLLAIAFCRFLSLLLFCCCGNSSRQGRRERPRRFFFCQCTSSRWAPTSRCRHKPATTWPWATPKTNKKLRATWHFSDSLLESGKKTRAKLKTPVTLDGLFPSIGGQLAFLVTLNYAVQGEVQVTGDQKMEKQIFPPPST